MTSKYATPTVYAPTPKALNRVWEGVAIRGADECWLWQRAQDRKGYGKMTWVVLPGTNGNQPRQANTLAHRLVWMAVNGPIPEGFQVDHLCRVRACCNPLHLRLLTRSENASDNSYRRQTHCKRGHEFTPENTRLRRGGQRACRTCERVRPA